LDKIKVLAHASLRDYKIYLNENNLICWLSTREDDVRQQGCVCKVCSKFAG